MSGGEPLEVQFSVRGEPTEIVILIDDEASIVGVPMHIEN